MEITMNLPQNYIDNMSDILDAAQLKAYLDSFQDNRLYGLRVNTMKISVEEFLQISPFKLTPIHWIDNGFYYSEEDKPAKHPYYYAGLYYIQEPSAMTPANVLPVDNGDIILDMCAAPGGKSTELGAKLNHSGLLVTNDISSSRAKALLKNIEVFGIPNVCVLNEDPKRLVSKFEGYFDKILIDAPCSGEGMFRKDNKLIKSWEKNGPSVYSKIQRDIILYGASMLRPGGKMLYSTCTFSKLENEETVRHLLKQCPDIHLINIEKQEGFCSGIAYDEELQSLHIERCVRLFPHKIKGEGHFMALFQKDANDCQDACFSQNALYAKSDTQRVGHTKIPKELEEFFVHTTIPLHSLQIKLYDTKVYQMVPLMMDNKGYRVIREGLLLGELKKNRFEPSQALAMALDKTQYDNVISLSSDDARIIKYLKGETLELPEFKNSHSNGWVLVCVDGYPLGWGKYDGYTLKNKYLAGWRWL